MDQWRLLWTSERSIRVDRPGHMPDPGSTAQLASKIRSDLPDLVRAAIPDASGMLIEFDVSHSSFSGAESSIELHINSFERVSDVSPDQNVRPETDDIVIPVCYDSSLAPDIQAIADELGCEVARIIDLHCGAQYQVTAMGFMPGFGYLGSLDAAIRVPRRTTPRTRVPAGSVAIAEDKTAVYPHQSAGGWNLIGRTPMRFFNPSCAQPSLLRVGDWVRFEPISREIYEDLRASREWGDR